MRLDAVYHRGTDNFCYAVNGEELQINLRTGDDVEKVFLHYGDPFATGILGDNGDWDGERREITEKKRLSRQFWWSIQVKPEYKRCRYFFELWAGSECRLYSEDGFFTPRQLKEGKKQLQCFTFPWMNPADVNRVPLWVKDTVWYQIFPERFCNGDPGNDPEKVHPWGYHPVTNREFYGGDLEGVRQKLDYLKELGINGIYLNPVFEAPSCHKYDTADYGRLDPHFGDDRLMKRLVEEAHTRGIRVMIDGVFNHCGSNFAPWKDVVEKGPASKYFDWFMVNRWPFSESEGDTRDGRYYSFAFASRMPKLNTNHPDVQEYFLDMVRRWIREFDIDGLRLDVANEISHQFCRKLRETAKGEKADFYILGEIWHDAMPWLRGDEFDAVMNYPLSNAIRDFWSSPQMEKEELEYAINRNETLYMRQTNEVLFNLLDSHDTNRLMDQAGNIHVFFQELTMLFTMQGSPCIFYGTEIAMEGGPDPDCRRCMPWEAIRRGDYEEITEQVKALIALRKSHPAFKSGSLSFLDRSKDPRVVEYRKTDDAGNAVEVMLNGSQKGVAVRNAGEILFERGLLEGRLLPGGVLIYTPVSSGNS